MSILIKGMEMPSKKAIAVVIHPDGTAYTAEMFAGVCTKYLADCTAVPVPPHGDLIDRYDLKNKALTIDYNEWDDTFDDGLLFVADLIDNAPTIIEAEGAE